jgi:hypothetical protein
MTEAERTLSAALFPYTVRAYPLSPPGVVAREPKIGFLLQVPPWQSGESLSVAERRDRLLPKPPRAE